MAKNDVKPEVKEVEQGRTVVVDADKLERILASNEEMSKRIGQLESNASMNTQAPTLRTKGTKEKKIKLRKWNNDYVIAWKNMGSEKRPVYVVTEYDKEKRANIEYVWLILKNTPEKPVKVDMNVYKQDSEVVWCLETGIDKKQIVTTQGVAYKKDFVENGYGMYETQIQVPLDVTEEQITHTVLLEDGEELTIDGYFIG